MHMFYGAWHGVVSPKISRDTMFFITCASRGPLMYSLNWNLKQFATASFVCVYTTSAHNPCMHDIACDHQQVPPMPNLKNKSRPAHISEYLIFGSLGCELKTRFRIQSIQKFSAMQQDACTNKIYIHAHRFYHSSYS